MSHIGVRIRLTVPSGVIYECDSDMAHYQAKYGAAPVAWCDPTCLPDCTAHGWMDLTAGFFIPPDIKVEIKPVHLADAAPDDDDKAPCSRCECSCGER